MPRPMRSSRPPQKRGPRYRRLLDLVHAVAAAWGEELPPSVRGTRYPLNMGHLSRTAGGTEAPRIYWFQLPDGRRMEGPLGHLLEWAENHLPTADEQQQVHESG